MANAYSGGCLCGKVTLAISGATIATRQCWCRQCQQIASGGPTNNAIFASEDVQINGTLAAADWAAASGNTLTIHFCSTCGTQIFAQSSARPQLKTIRLGVLKQPHSLKPKVVIWTEDAPDWAMIDASLEQWHQQPPPLPVS